MLGQLKGLFGGSAKTNGAIISQSLDFQTSAKVTDKSELKNQIKHLQDRLDNVFLPQDKEQEVTHIDISAVNTVIAKFETLFRDNDFSDDERHQALNTASMRCIIPYKTRPECNYRYLEANEGAHLLKALLRAGWDPEKITIFDINKAHSLCGNRDLFTFPILHLLDWDAGFEPDTMGRTQPTPKQIIAAHITEKKGLNYWNKWYKPALETPAYPAPEQPSPKTP